MTPLEKTIIILVCLGIIGWATLPHMIDTLTRRRKRSPIWWAIELRIHNAIAQNDEYHANVEARRYLPADYTGQLQQLLSEYNSCSYLQLTDEKNREFSERLSNLTDRFFEGLRQYRGRRQPVDLPAHQSILDSLHEMIMSPHRVGVQPTYIHTTEQVNLLSQLNTQQPQLTTNTTRRFEFEDTTQENI